MDKERLTRSRVIDGAVRLADEIGMHALTIRKLAEALDVGTMTVYSHVSSKEDIIDGMVDQVFSEIDLPNPDLDWKAAIKTRCISARRILNRHGWAAPYMESRTSPGPANLRHHDAVIGCLRQGGLSLALTAHAYAMLDSFVYGFAFEEATLPGLDAGEFTEVAAQMEGLFEAFPHLAEFTASHVLQPGYSFGDSFEFGLDLIIKGIDRAAAGEE